jgi:hypothetical protein
MAVTLKCPDCGHSVQSEDEKPRTCPQCDGTMKKPAYKAKSGPTSSDREKPKAEEKAKPKPAATAKPAAKEKDPFAFDDDAEDEPKPRKKPRDEDDEDERPKKKPAKKEEPLSLDDDDEKGGGGNKRDDAAAKSLDIDPGFSNKKLMRQVEDELSRGEVLHWAGRMCPEIAEKNAGKLRIIGIVFAGVGALFCAIFLAVAPWYIGLIPLIFVAIGVAIAILVPKVILKQAALGWYAVTDRRAIVYAPSAFGSGGEATSYEPRELRNMRVKKSDVVDGAGDLIFKKKVTERRTDYVDRKTGRTVRSETSTSETLYGFLGIENVREVETLVHNVLLEGKDEED